MNDYVLAYMLEHKIAITQRNYIELAYLGDKHSLEELEGEERAELNCRRDSRTGLLMK